jgi:dihydrofolate synthase/folylpolyglutamate synthase
VGSREAWLDGGHNPSAARLVADYARHHWTDGKPLHLLFASLTTKDPKGMLEPFAGLVASVQTLPIPGHASREPQELAELAGSMGLRAQAHSEVKQALAAVPADGRVLIFGSLYLAGEVLAANDQLPD